MEIIDIDINIDIYITHRHRHYTYCQRVEGLAEWRWTKWGKMGMERDFSWGDGCMMKCVDVSECCTLETSNPIHSIKNINI